MYFVFRVVLFFFNDTATTEIYTLSLHDALPIYSCPRFAPGEPRRSPTSEQLTAIDRKSTRLNSSHLGISHAVFCLKKRIPAVAGSVPPGALPPSPVSHSGSRRD